MKKQLLHIVPSQRWLACERSISLKRYNQGFTGDITVGFSCMN